MPGKAALAADGGKTHSVKILKPMPDTLCYNAWEKKSAVPEVFEAIGIEKCGMWVVNLGSEGARCWGRCSAFDRVRGRRVKNEESGNGIQE